MLALLGLRLAMMAVIDPAGCSSAVRVCHRGAHAFACRICCGCGSISVCRIAFFDPTELTIVLGDIGVVATKACGIVILAGLFTGAAALILRAVTGAR